ncbi:MAG: AMP-binding protein, partial [Planctomycetota bacterium]|nr:AMP-binding protein [Planctomycetota bacterium]
MSGPDQPSEPLGLVQRLARTATEHPDRLAFAFLPDGENESERLTFAQLEARVRSTAALLEAEGLAGTRAILLYPSGLDFVVAFLACLRAGVVSAPVPDVAAGREERLLPRLAAVARDARPSAILTIGARLGAAQKLAL